MYLCYVTVNYENTSSSYIAALGAMFGMFYFNFFFWAPKAQNHHHFLQDSFLWKSISETVKSVVFKVVLSIWVAFFSFFCEEETCNSVQQYGSLICFDNNKNPDKYWPYPL